MSNHLFRLDYGLKIEREIAELITAFDAHQCNVQPYPKRWLAIKLLEADRDILRRVRELPNSEAVLSLAHEGSQRIIKLMDDEVDLVMADHRYGFINGVVRQVLYRSPVDRLTLTDKIDDIVTHKWLGLPFFFLVMYIVFRLVIDVSSPFLDWSDMVITGPVSNWISIILELSSSPDWLSSLIVEGIVAGVGGVLVFVPGLLILYFFLAVLEDSGYMSRAAFVMDRFMRVVGLHGKSFIPMILGFGCAVPAVYATRTIASRRDRVLTALLIPLMSCSARLPVYVVFGLAFFGNFAGTVIWAMYALGIVVALLVGMLFTRTILKPDVDSAFVLELPPYRQPSLRSVLVSMWENTSDFIKKAGTTILSASMILWLLLNLPVGVEDRRYSYFGIFSEGLSPVLAPLGFGNWETGGALVTGFMAKEIVVSTMSQVYLDSSEIEEPAPFSLTDDLTMIGRGFIDAIEQSARILLSIVPGFNLADEETSEDTVLSNALRERFTPLSAVAFLVFVLLYVPCVATLAAIRHEFGMGWAIGSAIYQTVVAWLVAFLVFQVGSMFGLG
jgi:ferrous iron transport protein B